MTTYNCLIIEDEPLAQKVIQHYLEEYPQLKLVASCKNAVEARDILQNHSIDLIFLDINLPGTSGIDLVRQMSKPAKVIFTTAYSEYAAVSYDMEAVDYLLKPFTLERFHKSITKFLNLPSAQESPQQNDFIFLKVNLQLKKVFFEHIRYIEAKKNYLMIYTTSESFLTHMTLKTMEKLLSPAFIRIHRSFIVNKEFIQSIGINELKIGDKTIPIGEKYKAGVLKLFYK